MENALLVYKILGLLVIASFVRFGLQMGRPANSKYLTDRWLVGAMKLSASGLVLAFAWTIIRLKEIGEAEWAAIGVSALGSLIIWLAQRELKRNHAFSWTGYALNRPRLVTSGIYSRVRHPLYLGVYLTELGASILVFRQIPAGWVPVLAGMLAFAIGFNAVMAGKESRYLNSVFGDEYSEYARRVRSFIPKIL